MKRTLTAIVAIVGLASGANAVSLTIDTDSATYNIGDTITITATLDTAGAVGSVANQVVNVEINWIDALADALNATVVFTQGTSSQIITAGANVGLSNLSSFNGAIQWNGPPTTGCVLAGPGLGNTCAILNQSTLAGPFAPDTSILVGTLQLEAVAVGFVGLNVVGPAYSAFGVAPILGTNFQNATIVPEPTTAALLALGLVGLAAAGRRRQ
jgi:hypothetical protein